MDHLEYVPPYLGESSARIWVCWLALGNMCSLVPMHRLLRITSQRRAYASVSNANINQPFAVFDRNMKRIQRDRAASRNEGEDSRVVDYLRNEVADRMIERLLVSTFLVTLYIHLMLVGYQTYLPVYSRRRLWTGTFLALDRIKTNKEGRNAGNEWCVTPP